MHYKFIQRFSALSNCDPLDFTMLHEMLRRIGAETVVDKDSMTINLDGVCILTFELSHKMPRVFVSPVMLRVYAFKCHVRLRTIHEVTDILKNTFDASGLDPLYLNITKLLEHKADLILIFKRLQNHGSAWEEIKSEGTDSTDSFEW